MYISVAVLLCSTEILLSDCDVHFSGNVTVFYGNSAVGLGCTFLWQCYCVRWKFCCRIVMYISLAVLLCSTEILLSDYDVHFSGNRMKFRCRQDYDVLLCGVVFEAYWAVGSWRTLQLCIAGNVSSCLNIVVYISLALCWKEISLAVELVLVVLCWTYLLRSLHSGMAVWIIMASGVFREVPPFPCPPVSFHCFQACHIHYSGVAVSGKFTATRSVTCITVVLEGNSTFTGTD